MGEINPPTAADYASAKANNNKDRIEALEKRVALLETQGLLLSQGIQHLCDALERLTEAS